MDTEDTNEKMVTSDDDNDEDSSSSDEEEKKLESRTTDLERQLSDNKYLYDVHTELVDLYRKLGDLKSMRAAYERFAEYFPLTPSIWLTWIRDEIKLSSSASEKKYVVSLFDKAVEDYFSVDVWLEYVQFCIGNCELEQTQAVIERGLLAVGLDTNQGCLLWDAFREFELALLSLHEPLSEEWRLKAAKVAEVFRRQLSLPLLEMDGTYAEWQLWLDQLPAGYEIDNKPVEWSYQKALKLLATYKPLEERLLTAKTDEDVFVAYQDYISLVADPATVLCLYERAVAQLSLNPALWLKYCLYAMKLGPIACNVSQRALRNCPWSEELWIVRLRVLEQEKSPDKDVMECLEQGLVAIVPSPGLNLWLAYLEYIRRSSNSPEHLHKVFGQASHHLAESGDPTCKILRLQARLYAGQGDMKKARRVWSQILHFPSHKGAASAWLEFAALEKQAGDSQQVRGLYQRALGACTDWPQYVAEDWLMYERQCGSLKDVLDCEEKCSHVVRVDEAAVAEPETRPRHFDENKKRTNDFNDKNSKLKRMRRSNTYEEAPPTSNPTKKRINIADIDSEKAVFLSNMSEDVNEDKLREMFPHANAICLPTDRRGNSRCYAYVQFPEVNQVEEALSRDREPIDGRPLFISKCLPDQTQRKGTFKYSTSSEENKLFVRGLPASYSQEDVEGIFKPHGAVAVRLVLHRSGKSKGLAYVEFGSKEKAQDAIKATDQLTVADHTITVAVSAPPKKLAGHMEQPTNFVPTRNSRSRLQLPLIPRSVQVKTAETTSHGETSKTNADFRKMLLNKDS